jgi:hypothetical protein
MARPRAPAAEAAGHADHTGLRNRQQEVLSVAPHQADINLVGEAQRFHQRQPARRRRSEQLGGHAKQAPTEQTRPEQARRGAEVQASAQRESGAERQADADDEGPDHTPPVNLSPAALPQGPLLQGLGRSRPAEQDRQGQARLERR